MKQVVQNSLIILLGLVMFLFGLLFGYYTYHTTKVGLSGSEWFTASSTITYTYAVQAWAQYRGDSGLEYRLYPNYSFVATDGQVYHGNLQSNIEGWDTKRSIQTEEELEKYLVLEDNIYYNPSNPNQSFVERPLFEPVLSFVFLVLSLIWCALGLMIVWDRIQEVRCKSEQIA